MNLVARRGALFSLTLVSLVSLSVSAGERTPESCRTWERFHDGSCVEEARARSRIPPSYPRKARKEKVEARVEIRAVISKSGSVGGLRVESCSVPGYGFEKAAKRAVKRWKFFPMRVDGEPHEAQANITVDFKWERQPGANAVEK